MKKNLTEINDSISLYYSEKINNFGATPQGVDWNGEESQHIRFEQFSKLICTTETFSINDIGCGYGALLSWISKKYKDFSYAGFDISNDMIRAAQKKHKKNSLINFYCASKPDSAKDFSVASGIFNVRLNYTDKDWLEYLKTNLNTLNTSSIKGFAFNCLTSYSDEDKKRDYLYYANPLELFDFCKRNFSKQVALLHDYGLYEFTIIVRKENV